MHNSNDWTVKEKKGKNHKLISTVCICQNSESQDAALSPGQPAHAKALCRPQHFSQTLQNQPPKIGNFCKFPKSKTLHTANMLGFFYYNLLTQFVILITVKSV